MPLISVINESTAVDDATVQGYLGAFQQQWNQDLEPVWKVEVANFAFTPKGHQPAAGSWWLVFLDNSDQAGALAYHDLTNDGMPISKVFVKTLQEDGASLSVGATHELVEMAVDPWLNGAYQDQKGTFWAGEIADPVESDEYGYKIGDVLVTDFVTPSWFDHKASQGPLDLKGHATQMFQVLSGGYAQYFDPKSGWRQVTGKRAMETKHGSEAARGSRRDRRARRAVTAPKDEWQKSTVNFTARASAPPA